MQTDCIGSGIQPYNRTDKSLCGTLLTWGHFCGSSGDTRIIHLTTDFDRRICLASGLLEERAWRLSLGTQIQRRQSNARPRKSSEKAPFISNFIRSLPAINRSALYYARLAFLNVCFVQAYRANLILTILERLAYLVTVTLALLWIFVNT